MEGEALGPANVGPPSAGHYWGMDGENTHMGEVEGIGGLWTGNREG